MRETEIGDVDVVFSAQYCDEHGGGVLGCCRENGRSDVCTFMAIVHLCSGSMELTMTC